LVVHFQLDEKSPLNDFLVGGEIFQHHLKPFNNRVRRLSGPDVCGHNAATDTAREIMEPFKDAESLLSWAVLVLKFCGAA